MKITWTIFMVLALLSTVSSETSAAALETGGEIRVRGWRLEGYQKDGATTEFWDQRIRLGMTWPVAERVRVQFRADILEGMWGENYLADTQADTVDQPTGAYKLTATAPGAASKPPLAVDWLNLQFVWPGTPLLFSVGRQDVSWGPGFWTQDDNSDRFQVAAKLDPFVVVVAYDNFAEGFMGDDTKGDQRGWAIAAVTEAAGFQFGLLAAYLKDESRIRFPAGELDYVAGDFFARGMLGPAKLQVEVNYGSGTIERGLMGDLDAGGLGGYAGLFLPVGPLVTLGLEGAYARGDDPKTAGRHEGFFSADYHGPYWSVLFYNNYDYPGYAKDGQTSSFDLDFSVRNAVTGKFSAMFTPLKNLSITGAGLYAAADQTKDGVDGSLGWEFDVVVVYGITEKVSFTAAAGYALLGDYWKSAPIAGGGGRKPDNPLGGVAAFTTRF